jgi:hypothetical protein
MGQELSNEAVDRFDLRGPRKRGSYRRGGELRQNGSPPGGQLFDEDQQPHELPLDARMLPFDVEEAQNGRVLRRVVEVPMGYPFHIEAKVCADRFWAAGDSRASRASSRTSSSLTETPRFGLA